MQKTNISYLDFTWNPGCGCPLPMPSAGCANCWARGLHDKRHKAYRAGKKLPVQYAKPFHELQFFEDRLTDPLHKNDPAKIGVQFMGDLFAFPFGWIEKVMGIIEQCPQHLFYILTKRPHNMAEYFNGLGKRFELSCCPNLCLGVTVENDDNVGRIADLIRTPAAKRFVSFEPLLGRIDIAGIEYCKGTEWWCPDCCEFSEAPNEYEELSEGESEEDEQGICPNCGHSYATRVLSYYPFEYFVGYDKLYAIGQHINYAFIGCESGPGARLCSLDDIRYLMQQCRDAGVKIHVKQIPLNGRCNKKFDEWPKEFQVREV